MSEGLSQKCQLCKVTIPAGAKYGVLVFNIEQVDSIPRHPDGVISVHNSKIVNTMCMDCASKYDNESIKSLLD